MFQFVLALLFVITVSSLNNRFYSTQKVQIKRDDGIAKASTTVSARIRMRGS